MYEHHGNYIVQHMQLHYNCANKVTELKLMAGADVTVYAVLVWQPVS
jgi:hypothetical protein